MAESSVTRKGSSSEHHDVHDSGVKPVSSTRARISSTTTSIQPGDSTHLIDNSKNHYVPIKLNCGVKLCCSPRVLSQCSGVLCQLEADLKQCLQILPKSTHGLIRRTVIWVNVSYNYGPREHPIPLNHLTAHHHEGWLLWARDSPAKVLGIEIYSVFDYLKMRLHWNGSGLLLHEFCHLIHQQVLPNGLFNKTVDTAYQRADRSGLYERVLRRDWAGKYIDYDLSYAMIDHKEFFAEMSVTYLCNSYKELDNESMLEMERCCPPIREPNVYTRIQQNDRKAGKKQPSRLLQSSDIGIYEESLDPLFPVAFVRKWFRCELAAPPHCNKFYPFTRGQLFNHDRLTHHILKGLWEQISLWKDPSGPPCSEPLQCWCPLRRKGRKPILIMSNDHFDTVDL
jgi:hypothetical protein